MKISANSNIIIHPQAEKYRNQNRQLQFEASRLLAGRDTLKNSTVPQIRAEYQCKIGALELRVFQLECEVRAFIRRIEMANAKLNRGEKPRFREIEKEIKTEFADWQKIIKERVSEIKAAGELEDLPLLSRAESRELQTLYRKLAFLLHPDIVGSADERRCKLWLQAAEAYKRGDLPTLRTIRLLIADESPENDLPDETSSVLETLKNRHAELKRICEKMLDEIAEIKATAPFIWREILDDAARLENLQNELREKIEIMRDERARLVEHWAEIMRFAEDKDEIETPEEPADIFAETDSDWADIIYEF